jgi:Uma2 family endonuclease
MSTTTHDTLSGPPALEIAGPVARVPSLEEMEELTDVPDRRVVYRGVDWSFYDQLVESIPEWRKIHVDYDGKDLEIVRYGIGHHHAKGLLDILVSTCAEESATSYMGIGGPTLKRPEAQCGLEPCAGYLFDHEKRMTSYRAYRRGSDDIADYPNPELATEVDMTPPQVDRAGIYAALGVPEVWRFDVNTGALWFGKLQPDGSYASIDRSESLPMLTPALVLEGLKLCEGISESQWMRMLREWVRNRVA